MVNDLAELDLVAFGPNPAHRRSPLIARTAAGSARLAGIRAAEIASLAELAATSASGRVAAGVRVMDALTRHFHDQVRAAGMPLAPGMPLESGRSSRPTRSAPAAAPSI